jgi:hypothetical protein
VVDVDAGDDDGNDGGIGVPTPEWPSRRRARRRRWRAHDGGGWQWWTPPPCRPPEPQLGAPWPAPSGGCPPATKTGSSAIPRQ